jgi:hypothetical protein
MRPRGRDLRPILLAAGAALAIVLCGAPVASALPAPGWLITSIARPTNFSSSDHVDAVDHVTIKAAGGTFTLSLGGQSTASLSCDAPAATVQSQLEALSTIGAGNVSVTGGSVTCSEANTTPYVVTYDGSLIPTEKQPLTATSALTGTSTSATVQRAEGATADYYILLVTNVGGAESSAGAVVRDTLPPGVTATSISAETVSNKTITNCTLTPLACELPPIPPLETVDVTIGVVPATGASSSVRNSATVQGGGALAPASSNASPNTADSSTAAAFGLENFSFDVANEDGTTSTEAGGHPYSLTATFDTNTKLSRFVPPRQIEYVPVGQPKDVAVDLPLGFVGDPLASSERCPLADMTAETGPTCPAGSVVGYAVLVKGATSAQGSRTKTGIALSPVFNIVPEHGYPAELGVETQAKAVYLYASVARTASGYGLRVAVPSLTRDLTITLASLTFFGDPARQDGVAGPGTPETAFFTNPVDCSGGPLAARIEADSWQELGNWSSAESVAYSNLSGCGPGGALAFAPTFAMAPSAASEGGSSQADEPSAYTAELKVPQRTGFGEASTPELKNVTVTLPEGVSVSPSAAQGLQGCRETGPEGIDMPLAMAHPDEAGEGEEIGADGLAHLAAGHCPAASTLGTVEVSTPLLPQPLMGHVYLAQPKCGGQGQPACTQASATNGELFGLYIEAAGEGVIVKLPGTVAANPSTGQLTATFKENPRLPFEDLKLHFNGGPRAPLANPQACGSFAASSDLSAWSGGLGGTPDVSGPSAPFTVDWDGHGGACPASLPFDPGLSAGTLSPTAGGYAPLSVSFTRQDREQYLSAVQVKTPPGLLGMLSHVSLCGEPQAQQGTCGAESQIGSTTVAAGAGEHPFYLGGRVYITGPYDGAPFGLSVVVPALAGPFNLGDVIVRAAINVDPSTAALTITSGPLPQIIDGVPTRIRSINVTVDRPEFTFNATNCTGQQITATLAGSQGASASVSSPYAPSGCASLPFKPSLTASTQGQASKANGASLIVKVAQKPGEANIAKVELQLPKALPTRLSTLQKACTEAQFNTNPAGCPAGSVIGTAKATTPTLNVPLTGPAILVSHGGAAFPDVEFILQGQGVTIVLDGKTDIKNGITYSRFETVPDAPISSFETILPEGPYSILGAYVPVKENYNLCKTSLTMPTIITAQNGAQRTQSTKLAVTGCPPTLSITKTKVDGNVLLITLKASAAGTAKITGPGLKTLTKRLKAGTQSITVVLTRAGKAFVRSHRKIEVRASLTVGKQAVRTTMSVKL